MWMHSRKAALATAALLEYTDADQPDDDGSYQGCQLWHAQSYLEGCLWPANLRANLQMLLRLHSNILHGSVLPIDAVAILEDLAADNAIPRQWMHHHEYYYGGGRDDYF
jgi:hypothetical protein